MSLLDKLFKKNPEPEKKAEPVSTSATSVPPSVPTVQKERDAPYLTETVVFGMHLYRSPGDDSSVYFVDEVRGVRKMLVDSRGNIQNFPGIVQETFWTREVTPNALEPQIHFRTSFEKRDNRWIMLWQIQPDGRYWADDDGFGMENEEEVTLYTYVDMEGNFTDPFRIYRVGSHPYTLDRFENAPQRWYDKSLQALKDGNLETDSVHVSEKNLFPCLRGTPRFRNDRNSYVFWSREEALAYWNHPVLSRKILEATETLIGLDKPVSEIGSYECQDIICASLSLFWLIAGDARFKTALDKFFAGKLDKMTVEILSR